MCAGLFCTVDDDDENNTFIVIVHDTVRWLARASASTSPNHPLRACVLAAGRKVGVGGGAGGGGCVLSGDVETTSA